MADTGKLNADPYGGEIESMLEQFKLSGLDHIMRDVSRDFHDLAHRTAARCSDPARTVQALQDLLLARTSALRADRRSTTPAPGPEGPSDPAPSLPLNWPRNARRGPPPGNPTKGVR